MTHLTAGIPLGVALGAASHQPDVVDPAPLTSWRRAYSARVGATDALAILAAVVAAYLVRFGEPDALAGGTLTHISLGYVALSVALAVTWNVALTAGHTRDRRIVGTGPGEYQQVISASLAVFGALAVASVLAHMTIARGYLIVAFPLGVTLLLVERAAWRAWLLTHRREGRCLSRVLVVGHRAKVEALIRELRRHPDAGLGVIGVCLPASETSIDGTTEILGVPVLGAMERAAVAARAINADAVAVAGADTLTSDAVRRLGWDLEGAGIDLALAPSMTDIAGPRMLVRPVNGLPLVYVDEPRFTGPKYVVKTVMDWFGAVVLTLLLSPALVFIAVLVKTTSHGSVLYGQERIGVNGRTFRMLKFRSMVTNAHDRLAEVLAAEGIDEIGLFYKPKNDPRVTRIGRVLRKFSLDELPQLFNVIAGQMSLVGPRPQIAAEVSQYDRLAHRRLLVKPGLTGLWQVSGRSELSPEEGIRMDVYYVENWTPVGDLVLLARTAKVVIGGHGAY